jgi:hypothetical protein
MTLSVAEKIPGLLLRPAETFRAARDGTFGDAVTSFAALLIVNAVLSAIVGFLGFRAIGTPGTEIAAFLFALFAGIVSLIVGSLPLHIGVVMGGRGGFVQNFKAVVYGLTPCYLLGWVPVTGGLAGIWGSSSRSSVYASSTR